MNATGKNGDEVTDEMLMAFADGEADDTMSRVIEDALERDETLAERLEAFVATRRILKKEFADIAREPVPEHLTRLVMSGGDSRPASATATSPATSLATIPATSAHSAAERAASRWFPLSMAAAIAGVVAGITGYIVGSGPTSGPAQGQLLALAAADAPLAALLATGPDGGKSSWTDKASGRSGEIMIRASKKTRVGYCRTYGLTDNGGAAFGGVACRVGQAWRTEVLTAEGQNTGGYAPASGMAKAIDAFLDAAEAEEPLSAMAVQERISRGWQ